MMPPTSFRFAALRVMIDRIGVADGAREQHDVPRLDGECDLRQRSPPIPYCREAKPSSAVHSGTVHCPAIAAHGIVHRMRRPVRRVPRPRFRAQLDATTVPTWRPPRITGADAASLAFVLAPGRLPRGRRVYAIGDIHGCLEELRQLHAAIATDLVLRPSSSAVLVHLGDYIDFGPDSAGVLALLAAGIPITGLSTVNLMGDHERTALDALAGDGAAATDWLHTGGEATLASWDIATDTPRSEWRNQVPGAHIEFMQSLVLDHREGDYLFAMRASDQGFGSIGRRRMTCSAFARASSRASRTSVPSSCTAIPQAPCRPSSVTELRWTPVPDVAARLPARCSRTMPSPSCRREWTASRCGTIHPDHRIRSQQSSPFGHK